MAAGVLSLENQSGTDSSWELAPGGRATVSRPFPESAPRNRVRRLSLAPWR